MNRIRDLRLAAGMKQSELAARLACASTAVSKYELGQLDIGSAMINKLCDVFGVTADYLLGRSDNPQPAVSDADAELLRRYRKASFRDRELVDKVLSEYAEPEPEISGSAG